MYGGKLYGQGLYGVTLDFACKTKDNETFCNILKHNKIVELHLHSFNKDLRINKKKDIVNFIKYIHDLDNYVAKIFKHTMIIDDFKSFKEELNAMQTIYDIFGKTTEQQTTLTSLKFMDFNFVAVYIIFQDKSHICAAFSTKCNDVLNKVKLTDKLYNQLIRQILNSLKVMQKNNFTHSDIKYDNIIYCKNDNRFKLIDWGMAKDNKFGMRFGSTQFGSPLAHYLFGYPSFIACRTLYYHNKLFARSWSNSKIFKECYAIISKDFYNAINNKTKQELYELYKYKFDLFNFGFTLAYLIYLNNMNWALYKEVVINFISLSGSKNAKEAYIFFMS